MIWERIRDAAQARRMPIATLARAIGVSRSSLSKVLLGQTKLDAELLPKIAEVLGVNAASFFGEQQRGRARVGRRRRRRHLAMRCCRCGC